MKLYTEEQKHGDMASHTQIYITLTIYWNIVMKIACQKVIGAIFWIFITRNNAQCWCNEHMSNPTMAIWMLLFNEIKNDMCVLTTHTFTRDH